MKINFLPVICYLSIWLGQVMLGSVKLVIEQEFFNFLVFFFYNSEIFSCNFKYS